MPLAVYKRGLDDLADPIILEIGAGELSDVYEVDIWNDKGGVGGDSTQRDWRLQLLVWDSTLGTWVDRGHPALDELWARATVVGVDKTGDPSMPDYFSGTMPLGANSQPRMPDLPPNTAVKVNLQFRPPGSTSTTAATFQLAYVYAGKSSPLAYKVAIGTGSGVIPGYRLPGSRSIVEGGRILTDGSDEIIVERRLVDYDGVRVTGMRESVLLDQDDSAAATLASGESYYAALSVAADGSVTATKGEKDAVPEVPATPAGEILLGAVRVHYQAGGDSEIDSGDVDQAALTRSGYLVEAGTGLVAVVGGGEGISETDHLQWSESPTFVPLAPSQDSWIWKLPAGLISATDEETAPEYGAALLAKVTTDGAGVTAVEDLRTILDLPALDTVLELRHDDEITATGADIAWTASVADLEVHEVILEVADIGDGTGDSLQIDVTSRPPGTPLATPGNTIYTGSGDDDQRPSIAFDAANLRATSRYHEVRRFPAGTRFAVDVTEVPDGATTGPSGVRVYLRCRRYR